MSFFIVAQTNSVDPGALLWLLVVCLFTKTCEPRRKEREGFCETIILFVGGHICKKGMTFEQKIGNKNEEDKYN